MSCTINWNDKDLTIETVYNHVLKDYDLRYSRPTLINFYIDVIKYIIKNTYKKNNEKVTIEQNKQIITLYKLFHDLDIQVIMHTLLNNGQLINKHILELIHHVYYSIVSIANDDELKDALNQIRYILYM